MKVRYSVSSKIFALVLVAVAMAALAGGALQASNMGFKMNKVLQPQFGFPRGQNLVSLPFRNPYQTSMDKLCDAFALNDLTSVEQAQGPCGALVPVVHFCNGADVTPFNAEPRGVLMVRPFAPGAVAISGIIVGSHAGGPPGTSICGPGATVSRFPVLYHGTAANAQDICSQAGLAAGATIERIEAGAGVSVTHLCGAAGAFSLVLGEAVKISGQPANIIGFVPPHF